ncbi:hypothetical protein, partial [Pseudomonas sp. NPDC087690]
MAVYNYDVVVLGSGPAGNDYHHKPNYAS